MALALAPLIPFIPSQRQRHQARLRQGAALQGLFVEFRDLPGQPLDRRAGRVIYYGRRLPPSRGAPRASLRWERSEGGWKGMDHAEAAPAAAAQMPPPVLAIGQDEASCGAYWREAGEASEVAAIAAALALWEADLAAT